MYFYIWTINLRKSKLKMQLLFNHFKTHTLTNKYEDNKYCDCSGDVNHHLNREVLTRETQHLSEHRTNILGELGKWQSKEAWRSRVLRPPWSPPSPSQTLLIPETNDAQTQVIGVALGLWELHLILALTHAPMQEGPYITDNCSEMPLNCFWMSMLLPMKVANVSRQEGGT